jgi:dihydroorotase
MKILLKAVRITDVKSPHHNTSKDLLIENGIIQTIATSIDAKDATVIAIPQLHVSQGWVDFKSGFNDPGTDEGGGIRTGLDQAAVGGFTHVGVLPTDHPPTDTRSAIEYKTSITQDHAVKMHPTGAVSKGRKGQSLAEMADMCEAGTRWFSDNLPLNSRLSVQALLYARDLNSRIIFTSHSMDFSNAFQVNEGVASTLTGLPGHPAFDEKSQVMKIAEIARFTGAVVHISGISSRESLPVIVSAKNDGLALTCDVHLMNLCFNEERTLHFDTRFKVMPVLRTEEDRTALVAALKNGVIDAVVCDHQAVIIDAKRVPFDEADFGTLQLQTAYAALKKYSGMNSDFIVELLSVRNRTTFNIPLRPVAVDVAADLTLYLSEEDTPIDSIPRHLSPFSNDRLKGKAVGIIRGNQCILNQ